MIILEFRFTIKLNTDLNADGGYITISYDLGKTWSNIISDSTNNFCTSPMYDDYHTVKKGLYNSSDTLFNGTNGFSGNINQWTKVQFNWVKYMAVKKKRVDRYCNCKVQFYFRQYRNSKRRLDDR